MLEGAVIGPTQRDSWSDASLRGDALMLEGPGLAEFGSLLNVTAGLGLQACGTAHWC